jgi:hypothetical protein
VRYDIYIYIYIYVVMRLRFNLLKIGDACSDVRKWGVELYLAYFAIVGCIITGRSDLISGSRPQMLAIHMASYEIRLLPAMRAIGN